MHEDTYISTPLTDSEKWTLIIGSLLGGMDYQRRKREKND